MKAALVSLALCLGQTDYVSSQAEAIRTGKPHVCGIGIAPPVGGWVIGMVGGGKRLEGFGDMCVVVSVPENGYLRWAATLPPTATAADIRAALPSVQVPTERPGPPKRKRWDPYDQPDFQERVRRERTVIRSR